MPWLALNNQPVAPPQHSLNPSDHCCWPRCEGIGCKYQKSIATCDSRCDKAISVAVSHKHQVSELPPGFSPHESASCLRHLNEMTITLVSKTWTTQGLEMRCSRCPLIHFQKVVTHTFDPCFFWDVDPAWQQWRLKIRMVIPRSSECLWQYLASSGGTTKEITVKELGSSHLLGFSHPFAHPTC